MNGLKHFRCSDGTGEDPDAQSADSCHREDTKEGSTSRPILVLGLGGLSSGTWEPNAIIFSQLETTLNVSPNMFRLVSIAWLPTA